MSVIYSTMSFSGVVVKIAKIKKSEHIIRGSVDGNKFGTPGDVAKQTGFGDQALKDEGYIEGFAGNGGIFYPYDGAAYAEGIEISRGINNQDFSMACVTKFNNCMAIGFPKSGGIVFARQSEIIAGASQYWGAVTFAFGIMKDGVKAEWGKSEHSSQYNCISGRTILGQNKDYIFGVSFAGTTGKTGLRGSQLFELCKKIGMTDAGCFDGGGSVWMRVEGSYKTSTTRPVKNAWMIFFKEVIKEPKPESNEPIGVLTLNVASVGMYIRETLTFNAKNKSSGKILATVKVGQQAEVLDFIDGIQKDGYQWVKVKFGDIVGYAQYDSMCYWLDRGE